jgi:hypothetical protein
VDVRRARGELFVDIAFPIRDDSDPPCRLQGGSHVLHPIEPALGFLVCCGASTSMGWPFANAVEDLHVDEPEQGTIVRINGQHRMQQKATNLTALADRTEATITGPLPAEAQFAAVLDRQDISAGNALARTRASVFSHFGNGHRVVVQKAPKLDVSSPVAFSHPPQHATRPLNQSIKKAGPPFSSRRSPNRPSPATTVDMRCLPRINNAQGITTARLSQPRCVNTIVTA